ncbi:hypothetical protein EST38_g10970 [Candolleomyces aberdarensis]|uniref:SAC3/GANP/THP3 conserved domain-containing protein n=1 Tax=Candolleomyces aberdarensis TaxID=2316362 RepID=A0A4Q2D622_9AGAR|nr:hypothetical protein EST38_g10970 [Candolleomyces aberdarensis]
MEATFAQPKVVRGRGGGVGGHSGEFSGRGRGLSRNKHWVAGETTSRPASTGAGPGAGGGHFDGERWDRGAPRGRGRGRGGSRGGPPRTYPNATLNNSHSPPRFKQTPPRAVPTTAPVPPSNPGAEEEGYNDDPLPIPEEPVLETQEEREQFWQELVAARERERKQAITDGKMDDPHIQKSLDQAITIVGTCQDMCPRFERYRRERESNMSKFETIPGTKRIDHRRAIKLYERASGDKTIPSDLRPPHVLKKTLDYLFHDLIPQEGLAETYTFVRDRSRAVRNDFTMQHLKGPIAINCHDRCARYHILIVHLERPICDMNMENQQLMNCLQSLKEFYDDQRGRYESPTELEMRVYHRLIHIRDQRERHENIPEHIQDHPVFKLTTEFRLHVQNISSPITRTSPLVVDAKAMEIFGRLAGVLREMGNMVMIYLVACVLERVFGKDTIEDIESLRVDLSIPDIIDGKISSPPQIVDIQEEDEEMQENEDEYADFLEEPTDAETIAPSTSWPPQTTVNSLPFGAQPASIFAPNQASSIPSQSSVFSATRAPSVSVFGQPSSSPPQQTPFPANQSAPGSIFGSTPLGATPPQISAFSNLQSTPGNVFGTANFGAPASSTTTSIFGTFGAVSTPSVSQVLAPPPPQPTFPSTLPTAVPATQTKPFFSARPVLPAPTIIPPTVTSPPPPPQLVKSNIFSTPPAPSPAPTGPFASTSSFTTNAPTTNGSIFGSSVNKPFSLNPKAPSFVLPPPQKLAQSQSEPVLANNEVRHEFSGGKNTAVPVVAPALAVASSSLVTRTRSTSSASSCASGTPPPLKIDTSISSSTATPSPREPPLLSRVQPVSLPSTPTIAPPPSALLSHLRGNLETPPSSASDRGFLSPLAIQTPRPSIFAPPELQNFSLQLPLGVKFSSKDKGKGKAPENGHLGTGTQDLPPDVLQSMQEKALAFERHGVAVRECLRHWVKKAIDRAAWIEACKQSDAYSAKIRLQRTQQQNGAVAIVNGTSKAANTTNPDRKRRMEETATGALTTVSLQNKRQRRRVPSTWQPPMRDEELARRLYEHQQAVLPPAIWQIWLSTNPVHDPTAIWLDTKFGVPDSGSWLSESVFSIPLEKESVSGKAHPGVVVFECSPVEGVEDELEKKYRVLDDCSRLRDIVKSFPARRYYVPSVLFICYVHNPEPYAELFAMADKLKTDRTIKGYNALTLTQTDKDPDEKLRAALNGSPLDMEGELVRTLSVRDLYKQFLAVLNPFMSEWNNSCQNVDHFNWKLYNLLLHIVIDLFKHVAKDIRRICEVSESTPSFGLIEFEDNIFDDSDSAYDAAEDWLSSLSMQIDVSLVLVDIESHRKIEQDFPSRAFLDHIVEIAQAQAESTLGEDRTYLVLTADLEGSVAALEESLSPLRVKLSHRLNNTARRSPRRRSRSVATSQASPESKRMRLSTASSLDGDATSPFSSPVMNGQSGSPSPSPSVTSLPLSESTAGGQQQQRITAAMLRALTQDLKKKYIRPS